jgi:hypothetical protein
MSNLDVVKRQTSGKRGAFITGLAAVIVAATLSTSPAQAQNGRAFECSERTLEGTYGIQVQGTRPVPPALGGGREDVIGVVIRTYDGFGNFSQIGNVKGLVTGIVPDQPGFGTYVVSANCTAIASFQPAPGVVLEERLVIMHDGSEVRAMTLSPAALMVTGVGKRIDRR